MWGRGGGGGRGLTRMDGAGTHALCPVCVREAWVHGMLPPKKPCGCSDFFNTRFRFATSACYFV